MRRGWDCPDRGSVGLGQFPVDRIPLHRAAAHGGPVIAPAHQIGVSAPHAARPRLNTEKFRIRFDDPDRARPSGTRGTGPARNPLRRPKDWETRHAVAPFVRRCNCPRLRGRQPLRLCGRITSWQPSCDPYGGAGRARVTFTRRRLKSESFR